MDRKARATLYRLEEEVKAPSERLFSACVRVSLLANEAEHSPSRDLISRLGRRSGEKTKRPPPATTAADEFSQGCAAADDSARCVYVNFPKIYRRRELEMRSRDYELAIE